MSQTKARRAFETRRAQSPVRCDRRYDVIGMFRTCAAGAFGSVTVRMPAR